MNNPLDATNATKALVGTFINAWLGVIGIFGFGTQEQLGAIGVALNATYALYVAFTYTRSPKRIEE